MSQHPPPPERPDTPAVKPLEQLIGPARELVQAGALASVPFTVPPLTLPELLLEEASLRREVGTCQRRLAQNLNEQAALTP